MGRIMVLVKTARTSTSVRASLTRFLIWMASLYNLVNGSTSTLSFNLFPSLSISASNLLYMDQSGRESRAPGSRSRTPRSIPDR